jgi:solute carrier family 25 (mitochondrial thiamine pyrophosphate transporter), member 19
MHRSSSEAPADHARKLNKTGEALAGAFAGGERGHSTEPLHPPHSPPHLPPPPTPHPPSPQQPGFSRFLVAPLDVLKIRFQLQTEPVSRHAALSSTSPSAAPPRPLYTSMAQAVRALLREEGVKTLWRGNGAAVALWVCYMGVQFPVYRTAHTATKEWLGRRRRAEEEEEGLTTGTAPQSSAAAAAPTGLAAPSLLRSSLAPSLIAGAVAGCAATVSTYPLDWLRTRMASQGVPPEHPSMLALVRAVLGTRGVQGLFQGLVPTLLQVAPALAITFATYDHTAKAWDKGVELLLERRRRRRDGGGGGEGDRDKAPAPTSAPASTPHRSGGDQLKSLVCGAAAGTLGKLFVYPLDTVKKRLQTGGMQRAAVYGRSVVYRGTWDALTRIAREEGVVRGLFKGTAPSLLKAGAAAALTFWSYESAAEWLRGQEWAADGGREGEER